MLDIDIMNIDVDPLDDWKQDLIDPYIGTYMYIVVLNHIRSYIYFT